MLEFSKVATLEKNKLSTDAPFLMFIELTHEQLDAPIYLVRNTEDVTWRKLLWTAFPLDVESYDEDGKTLPSVNLKISAGRGIITSYLQRYSGLTDARVSIYIVNAKLLDSDKTEMEYEFQVTETSYDEQWITFTLGASPELANRFPAWKHLNDFCPFVCGDIRCGYTGTDTCRNNLASCLISERFGGEPGIQSGRG
nr:MAG TPA: minor tail protein L [Caudoviricetes sp.]